MESQLTQTFGSVIQDRPPTSHFDDTPVPVSVLAKILNAGHTAPSGHNLQPARFLLLRSAERKAALRRAAFGQEKITEAPIVIVAFAPRNAWKETAYEIFAESARRGAIPSLDLDKTCEKAVGFVAKQNPEAWLNRQVMIAFTHLMLAAESLGWDTAPMEGFDAAAVRKELGLAEDTEIVALLAIGRLKGQDKPFPGRLPLSRVFFNETADRGWEGN